MYAAYRSGCLGDNILDTYFRFFANIIYDQHWEEIDEATVKAIFTTEYCTVSAILYFNNNDQLMRDLHETSIYFFMKKWREMKLE